MTDSKEAASTQKTGRSVARDNHALRARFERHRALRSAWGVLAPSGLSAEKQDIAETGRALNDDLIKLASQDPSGENAAAIREIDARLDALEGGMRAIGLEVPVAQLRSTLPARIAGDRRGVLDLLDLILGAEIEGLGGTEERIAAIDYLITLLCTAGAGTDAGALQDPVTLTPRLYGLCERSDVDYDSRLPEIEAEFFAAADMWEADARGEIALRTLRRRKTELGSNFFAPRVLRAIVTYNAALLKRIDEEVLGSLDWGPLPHASEEPGAGASVFEAPALPKLAEALRRRAAGDAPDLCAVDRVAWCLDLAYPDKSERAALLCESAGLLGDLKATAILVGLLCRSAVVLEEEFLEIGISPQRLSGEWVQELEEALKQEINRRIAGDDYREACLLSELKSKFLYASMAGVRRTKRGRGSARPAASSHEEVARAARQIADEAIESERTEASRGGPGDRMAWLWAYSGRAAAAACCVLLALALAGALLSDRELDRYGSGELDRLSAYLSRGARSGEGTGTAFVGTIDTEWCALETAEQEQVAKELVRKLRAQGVREIMVFDDERELRIQALGVQPARVLPGGTP